MGHCTINPWPTCPSIPTLWPPASKQETVLIVGGGAAGMQAAITACDRGQKAILAEQGPAWAACCGSPTWTPTSPI